MADAKEIGGVGTREVEGSTGAALVTTKPEHRKEYELIRQQGNLPVEAFPDARILAIRDMVVGRKLKVNSAQLAIFLGIGHKHGLSPELRELWLINIPGQGPTVYAGRDGFLKAASRQPQMYGGISSGVVYPQDEFRVRVQGGQVHVHHEFDPRERSGYPHGAYCIVWDAGGHPTYVYRVFDQCKQMKSTYWSKHYDDAIHNRAVAAGLRRVVSLGGLLIEGELPIGATSAIEEEVEKKTLSRLSEIGAELGLEDAQEDDEGDDPVVPLGEDGKPDEEAVDALLDEYAERYEVSPHAFRAYAAASGSFPDDLADWTVDHKVIALQEMKGTEGFDFDRELAKALAEREPNQEKKFQLLEEIMNLTPEERPKLKKLIASLYDRLED